MKLPNGLFVAYKMGGDPNHLLITRMILQVLHTPPRLSVGPGGMMCPPNAVTPAFP